MCVECRKSQAGNWNDAVVCGGCVIAVGDLYVDGIGIGMDIVALDVGLENMAFASCVGYCMVTRGKVCQGEPQIFIIE